MRSSHAIRGRVRLTLLNGLLLGVIGLAIVGVQALDRGGAAVEGSVRRYATAVSNAELDEALAEIAPDQRATWQDWIRGQLGNVYDVRGIAVRSPSLVDRVLHAASPTGYEVTAILDVDRDFPDQFYQPTTRVSIAEVDGRWYLARPLLAEQN